MEATFADLQARFAAMESALVGIFSERYIGTQKLHPILELRQRPLALVQQQQQQRSEISNVTLSL